MNHKIKISTDSLQSESGKIAELASKAEKQLKEIYGEVETLDAMWDGPANETFVKQFLQDYEMLKQMCGFVKNFAEDMNEAAAEYNRCENNVKSAVSAIRV